MNINIHCTTSSQDTSTFRRMMLLVTCLFVGSFIGMGVVGIALADDDDHRESPKNTFNIMMNYELGMHCTGFEFAYCCVLPPYNSILAQVVKTQRSSERQGAFAKLLQGDPNVGLDPLGRETVLRDADLLNNNFQKYVLTYEHQAQPRKFAGDNFRGKAQVSTLISAVEGNSLFMWSTIYDQTAKTANGAIKTSTAAEPYNGAVGAPVGNGVIDGSIADSYANGWMNHLYIYSDLEGTLPGECTTPAADLGKSCTSDATCGESAPGAGDGNGLCDKGVMTTRESNKIRLGMDIVFQHDCGPAAHPMGPVTSNGVAIGSDPNHPALTGNDCGGLANGNLLTFSADSGTVVYTQMKVLENLPVTLTSPRIWEALGLPLTPFEDTIDFFADPGMVDEDSIRPYVKMVAKMHRYDPNDVTIEDGDAVGVGDAVMQNGNPVIGFGTAPIDIPNCERCHSNGPDTPNSPQADNGGQTWKGGSGEQWALVQSEYNFWNTFYLIDPASQGGMDSDWYSRLKSAAVSMLYDHDLQHGTSFTTGGDGPGGKPDYPACGGINPVNPQDCIDQNTGIPIQNTRMGHESVICQKCHADNVIAAVKSAECAEDNAKCEAGTLIRPISEAIHRNHRSVYEEDENGVVGVITFNDRLGRDGGCQGCHPAHRSDGDMEGYPITLNGENFYADSDNRLASGGCFVGRDVHSNPGKDSDGAETPEHLNAVGAWLSARVFDNQTGLAGSNQNTRGIWCTNCHTQLSQEIWKNEDCDNLIESECVENVRGAEVDPNGDVDTPLNALLIRIGIPELVGKSWLDPKGAAGDDPNGTILSADGVDRTHDIWKAADPGNVYTQDANVATIEVGPGGPELIVDADGDISVNILSFCTTQDCVKSINDNPTNEGAWRHPEAGSVDGTAGFINPGNTAVAVPFSAATDGRDHWLSAGEPHCADCHAAPYVEQSGNINAFAPFNYPAKAGLMRYSRGHRDITCQGCHESIHGLYPVTPSIDTTTYAQAASMNSDDSHGPLKCGACHQVNGLGVHSRMDELRFDGQSVRNSLDAAIGWAHVFTADHSPLDDMCRNCHGDERDEVRPREEEWQEHAMRGRASRLMMNQVEIELLGAIAGTNPATGEGDANIARTTVCRACHDDEFSEVSCSGEDGREWKRHLTEGRVAQTVWEAVARARTGTTCGW